MTCKTPNVIQATAWYPPYNLGGTEVYVEGLVDGLMSLGIESKVIVPRHPHAGTRYIHKGIVVTTYPVNTDASSTDIRRKSRHRGFDEFINWLKAEKGGIYHQHSWTRGCGPHHLRAAHELGFKTVLTVHVPGNICFRGTMMRYGQSPCDGRVIAQKCGACWLEGRGMPRAAAGALTRLPEALTGWAQQRFGRIGTMLSARSLAKEKLQEMLVMASQADIIVAVCQWLYDALLLNGVSKEKLLLCRQGVTSEFAQAVSSTGPSEPVGQRNHLRVLYLGRWDSVKGVNVVVEAIRRLPVSVKIQLSIRAISDVFDDTFEMKVRKLAEGDERIRIDPPVERSALSRLLAEHDVVAVPSLWMETGPLVVLEAQAMGLFVLGSKLGGIAELVGDGRDGILLPPGDPRAWAAALERLAADHAAGRLKKSGKKVRTMDTVAAEMEELYWKLAG